MPTRATMTISLPQTLRTWVERLVPKAGYGTASEYIRELVREDQKRRQRHAAVTDELASILAENDVSPLTAGDWKEIRAAVRNRAAAQRARRP